MRCHNAGLGSSPFARHYLGNHCLFSLPRGTKMFQFPPFASIINMDSISSRYWVVPFGNPRINGYLLLPAAYRSLSRLSSTSGTKAFTIHPCSLTIFFNPTDFRLSKMVISNARYFYLYFFIMITINFSVNCVLMHNCVSVSIFISHLEYTNAWLF